MPHLSLKDHAGTNSRSAKQGSIKKHGDLAKGFVFDGCRQLSIVFNIGDSHRLLVQIMF